MQRLYNVENISFEQNMIILQINNQIFRRSLEKVSKKQWLINAIGL